MERDAFHVPYLLDKTPEAVSQAVKTVAHLRVSTTQDLVAWIIPKDALSSPAVQLFAPI